MTQGQPSLLDDIGDAATGAGSEALAAIKNVGGGDAGGTVGRLVSAVAGRHGGFAPKVITSVTKHGIAGIERVEPIENVDRGYRAVAADANGLESIRTVIELDPREYDVTVTRDEGAGVVEFVQQPKPEPETEAVEPSPPVKESGSAGATAGTGRPSRLPGDEQASAAPVRTAGTRRDDVAEARAAAEKAKAEAEAEKARAEAETARAEAEAAKARAHTERARADSRTGESLPGTAQSDAGGCSPATAQSDAGGCSPATAQSDGGSTARDLPTASGPETGESTAREQPAASGRTSGTVDVADVDPAIGAVSVAGGATSEAENAEELHSPERVEPASETDTGRANHAATGLDGSMPDAAAGSDGTADEEKWGLPDDAGASAVSSATTVESPAEDGVASPDAPLRTAEPLDAETVDEGAGGEATGVDDGFSSFVTADPVSDEDRGESATADESAGESAADAESTDEGISRWAGSDDSDSAETSGFEF
jgi:hypothetical protein